MPTCDALLWNTKIPAGEDSFLISLNPREMSSPRDAPGLRMSLPELVQGGYGEWSGGAAIRPIMKWALFSCAPRTNSQGRRQTTVSQPRSRILSDADELEWRCGLSGIVRCLGC